LNFLPYADTLPLCHFHDDPAPLPPLSFFFIPMGSSGDSGTRTWRGNVFPPFILSPPPRRPFSSWLLLSESPFLVVDLETVPFDQSPCLFSLTRIPLFSSPRAIRGRSVPLHLLPVCGDETCLQSSQGCYQPTLVDSFYSVFFFLLSFRGLVEEFPDS